MRETEAVDPSYHCQIHGILAKKPIGSQGNKWSKRFFIVKDGYLLYYAENEKKEFEKKKIINTHPKGVIPLGGCIIQPTSEPGQSFSIQLKNDDISGDVVIAADSAYDQDKWVTILRQSARITWRNALLGDALIDQLEDQGLQMAKEKQDYFDKLQDEATALHDEKEKTEELERLNDVLQKERVKMEEYMKELKEEYEKIKMELDSTVDAMNEAEEDTQHLNAQTQDLQKTLEDLETEKQMTLDRLHGHKSEKKKVSKEKLNSSVVTTELQNNLEEIESKTLRILEEKALAEERLQEAILKTKQLEDDKKVMKDHAEELRASIKDMAAQKAITEAELKEEVIARLEAEKRLIEAEASLQRLENAVVHQDNSEKDAEQIKEEMIVDVRTLKKFFENLVFEAKLDADKSVMIKNSIHARKSMVRRAKTMKFEASKKRRSRDVNDPRSPVSPCESPFIHTAPAAQSRFTKSTIFLTDEDVKDMSWLRHSVIGIGNTTLSSVSEEEVV